MFTVGDGKDYGGFKNGELEPDRFYAIFLTGLVYKFNGVSFFLPHNTRPNPHFGLTLTSLGRFAASRSEGPARAGRPDSVWQVSSGSISSNGLFILTDNHTLSVWFY